MRCLRIELFLTLILIFSACSKNPEGAKQSPQSLPPTVTYATKLDVTVYEIPQAKTVPVEVQYPARTKSISMVTVVARVSGILKERYFVEGQFVNKDQLLFKIEPDIYQAEYDSAKAQLEQAMAEFNRAERDWQRIKASYEDRIVSEQQRDAALSAYEQAKALVEAAKARLKQAELNLRYTDVKAPVSGIAGTRLVDPGNMVNPGTALVTITEVNPIYAEFSIPDSDLIRLKTGCRPTNQQDIMEKFIPLKTTALLRYCSTALIIEDRPYRHSGKIDFIDSVIDEKTSSLKARAVFPNPDRVILPNQFVRIVIKGIQRRNAIVVPQKAVLQSPSGPFVYIVENGKAIVRDIKLGERVGDNFVVEDGLKPGDLVIVDNLMKIRPEMPVKIGEGVKR
jgi:membrane fusion protein (multidrug efflux system)